MLLNLEYAIEITKKWKLIFIQEEASKLGLKIGVMFIHYYHRQQYCINIRTTLMKTKINIKLTYNSITLKIFVFFFWSLFLYLYYLYSYNWDIHSNFLLLFNSHKVFFLIYNFQFNDCITLKCTIQNLPILFHFIGYYLLFS